ncbi:P-loop NTPase fold protein [Latilactobacillus sp. 5-91]|uniref:P-loop NTPase fold protein n=1 Tax=Latilactobacillus sp. 5-91 TaxID=3410924 RepID=UPI003C76935F
MFENKIDTKFSEQRFGKYLKLKKTYFLNGSWGSGKTTFLEKIKEKDKELDIKVINLWRITNNRSIIKEIFVIMHPWIYYLSLLIMIMSIIISILATDVVNIGLSKSIQSGGFWTLITIVSLFVAVAKFMKLTTDSFFLTLFRIAYLFNLKNEYYLHYLEFTSPGVRVMHNAINQVLIFDDFDRVSEDRQLEAYKIFNILQNRITIVFTGDINIISRNDGNFLQKIVDERIELPLDLQPIAIWDKLITYLMKDLNVRSLSNLKAIAVSEERNLRDRKRFIDLVDKEFYTHNKKGHVQVEQQLIIIYIYLFHTKLYRELLDGKKFVSDSPESEKQVIPTNCSYRLTSFLVKMTTDSTEISNRNFPRNYIQNNTIYYIYAKINNDDKYKLLEDIATNQTSREDILMNSDYGSDKADLIFSEIDDMKSETFNSLLETAMQIIKTPRYSDLLQKIISQKIWRVNDSHSKLDLWNNYFEKYNYSSSQKLFFIYSYLGAANEISDQDHFKSLDTVKKADITWIALYDYIYNNRDVTSVYKLNDKEWKILADFNMEDFAAFWQFISIELLEQTQFENEFLGIKKEIENKEGKTFLKMHL